MKTFALIALGLAIAAMGIYVANADDAPGAAVMGMLLMVAGVVLGVRAARNRLPVWAARTALAVGVVVAAFAAFLTHQRRCDRAALPTVAGGAIGHRARRRRRRYAAAVERARELVRAAAGGAEPARRVRRRSVPAAPSSGPKGSDGGTSRTRTPVTPDTRFNIGTAAAAVAAAVAPLGLTNTGADAAKEWSPEAIGEEGEDFPPLTLLRHVVWQPLGLMPAEYPLPGERATFYVPRSDDNDPRRGRRLMYMRDLACCANGMAFYSTPSDLVRFALATNPDSVNGELAGGMVMSLMTRRDSGIVIAVTSNMAHANTSSLAQRVGDAFAEQTR